MKLVKETPSTFSVVRKCLTAKNNYVSQDDKSHKKKAALKAIHPIQAQLLQLGLLRRDFTCVGAVKKSRLVLAPKKWSPHAIHTFETHTHTF